MKPVAYLHTFHMEAGQTDREVTFTKESPWGKPGVDHDKEYYVTTEPLYRRSSKITKGNEQ